MFSPEDIVACICEGNTEKNIINMLLNQDKLKFSKYQLLEEEILTGRYRNPKNFTDQYLTMDYGGEKLVILSIQDSRNSTYSIKKVYTHQIKGIYLVITAPEIEMLMIHATDLYNEYQKVKSSKKPSKFLCNQWKIKGSVLKSEGFVKDFFSRYDLIDAIKKHKGKTKKYKNKNRTIAISTCNYIFM